MIRSGIPKPLCKSCSRQLLDLFAAGFASPRHHALPRAYSRVTTATNRRAFRSMSLNLAEEATGEGRQYPPTQSPRSKEAEREARVRLARQIYGETLPENHLSQDEYKLYERLYGSPTSITSHEDDILLQPAEEESKNEESGHNSDVLELESTPDEQNKLFGETESGALQEIPYTSVRFSQAPEIDLSSNIMARQEGETDAQFTQRMDLYEQVADFDTYREFGPSDPMQEDLDTARSRAQQQMDEAARRAKNGDNSIAPWTPEPHERPSWADEISEDDVEVEEGQSRQHPLTTAGKFATFPRTILPPAYEFTEPIQSHLAENAKYSHLVDAARAKFGGTLLPDTNATPPASGRHFQQKKSPLSAFQSGMTGLEANLFMSLFMPGAYASVLSIMVEIRKRLGSSWLETVLERPGGPRVLDVGAGGAGVIAWREVLQAEWEQMHVSSGKISQNSMPLGSSTVVAGSHELQATVSRLLSNTTFIPRLPDFNRSRDLSASESSAQANRKQYDMIIASYALFGLEEDYMRKDLVQNLWSLLDPNGGVLIILEKGIPKGFEMVAGARKVLLQHHIQNPNPAEQDQASPLLESKHSFLEEGMIIAPCTNHNACPLHRPEGNASRRDSCRFSQRFQRPAFMQRIVGAKFHNYEDISFSYVAAQRGRDLRKQASFAQNAEATQRAKAGYEDADDAAVPMLALPRIIAPPLKRTGHVTMNMCTPHGTLEQWTVPKSFSRQAYRDARKARWGDLWALGAKTAVPRQLSVGTTRGEDADEGEDGFVDERLLNKKPKRNNRGRRGEREPRKQSNDVEKFRAARLGSSSKARRPTVTALQGELD